MNPSREEEGRFASCDGLISTSEAPIQFPPTVFEGQRVTQRKEKDERI